MNPKPSRKEVTHDRILETASRAIRRAGCGGVGVADIMKEAGLTHGGFYAHFASRDAMLAEALEYAGRQSAARITQRAASRQAQGTSPLRALVEGYLADTHLLSCESGCPVAALASEMPRQAPEVREVARGRVRGLLETVRRALPAGAPAQDAMAVAGTLVGALQLARVLGHNAEGKALLAASRQALIDRYDQGRGEGAPATH
jgi:AcrR family transcriptional regulator